MSAPARLAPLAPRREWVPNATGSIAALRPLHRAAALVPESGGFPSVDALSVVLAGRRSAGGAVLSFERQTKKEKVKVLDQAYDARIFLEGRIPTREGSYHDYFNALVWGTFPRAKIAVNARQFAALSEVFSVEGRMPSARTREQDALAMLDEGGLLLATDEAGRHALEQALVADGSAGSPEQRVADLVAKGRVRALVFGHALAEHMVSEPTVVRGLPVVLTVPTERLGVGEGRPAGLAVDGHALEALVAAVDEVLEELLRGDFARRSVTGVGPGLLAMPVVGPLFAPFERTPAEERAQV